MRRYLLPSLLLLLSSSAAPPPPPPAAPCAAGAAPCRAACSLALGGTGLERRGSRNIGTDASSSTCALGQICGLMWDQGLICSNLMEYGFPDTARYHHKPGASLTFGTFFFFWSSPPLPALAHYSQSFYFFVIISVVLFLCISFLFPGSCYGPLPPRLLFPSPIPGGSCPRIAEPCPVNGLARFSGTSSDSYPGKSPLLPRAMIRFSIRRAHLLMSFNLSSKSKGGELGFVAHSLILVEHWEPIFPQHMASMGRLGTFFFGPGWLHPSTKG